MTESTRISTPADLVASIPAFLGFIPAESLVIIALKDARVLFAARHDLAAIPAGAAMLAHIAAHNNTEEVVLVGIGAKPTRDAHEIMIRHLAGYAIEVRRQIHVSTCEHATQFVDYQTGETGMTRDYRDSTATLRSAVEEGRVVRASRKDCAAIFATTGETTPVDTVTIDPAAVVADMVAAISQNTDPGAKVAAQFGALIGDVRKRDAMLRLGIENTGTAAVVMARTAAHLRSDPRARVLTLAMFFFYLAGDGAAAGMAADTVSDEKLTPTSFMTLLDQSLRTATHPDKLRDLIPTQESASAYLERAFPI